LILETGNILGNSPLEDCLMCGWVLCIKADFSKLSYQNVNQIDVVEDYVNRWSGKAWGVTVASAFFPLPKPTN
jgi:hypothetical protein